jgi:hypothetical protein
MVGRGVVRLGREIAQAQHAQATREVQPKTGHPTAVFNVKDTTYWASHILA